MAVKAIFVLCAAALLVQSISGVCPSGSGSSCGCGSRLAPGGLLQAGGVPALSASGGNLPVTSYSPLAPRGIAVESQNVIDGTVNLCGALPLLAAVAFEGQLPSAGSAGVSYGCGDNVAITGASSGYGNRGLGRLGSSCGCGCGL